MANNNTSGVDSLIDALRKSGAPVDDKFKTNTSNSNASSSSTNNTNNTTNNSAGASGFSDIGRAVMNLSVVDKAKNMGKRGKIISVIVIILLLGIAY